MSNEGLYLGTEKALRIEPSRIQRVLRRIVTGLYYHELGRRVPSMYVVRVILDQFGSRSAKVLSKGGFPPARRVGDGLFLYTFMSAVDDSDSTIWLGAFYEQLSFLALVQPGRASPARR